MNIFYKTIPDICGSGHYRTFWPHKHLLYKQSTTNIIPTQIIADKSEAIDNIIFSRFTNYYLWHTRRNYKNRFYDIDDNMFQIPKCIKKAYEYYSPAILDDVRKMMNEANKILVVSKHLSDYLKNEENITSTPIEIVPSYFPDLNWFRCNIKTISQRKHKQPRILFVGTVGYTEELNWLLELAKKTEHKYKWVIVGFENNHPSNSNVIYKPYTYTEKHLQALDAYECDIAIHPKFDNIFNKCRGNSY